MYTRILIPLDGSKTAENVLPYARTLANTLKIPVELIGVVDIGALAGHLVAEKARYLDVIIAEAEASSRVYLERVGRTFPTEKVAYSVQRGIPAEAIIERAGSDKNTLIAMATHGRSGINRWLLGSVTEKVLRGASNPLLLVRATEEAKTEGEAPLKSVIVPLDGSPLAETVLPTVVEISKKLSLEIILFRAYNIPYNVYAGEGYYAVNLDDLLEGVREEASDYLEKKSEELKKQGAEKVSCVVKQGLSADEIISFGKKTPDNLIGMCTHGRSGVKRWVLGSVTETVVRHCGEPVLVIRAT
jgi:nucleotide-binding universal stress UspA family protein